MADRIAVMRDGRIEQVASPHEIFTRPANLFVAGFIGSPAMNFVTADLVRDSGPAVTFAGYRLDIPASVIDAKPGLEDYFGRRIILGIRPSDFEDASLGDGKWARMPVTVGVTEELGSEIHVIFTIDAPPVQHASISDAAAGDDGDDESVAALVGGKSLWTARVSARSAVRPGQPVELGVDTSNLQFFDPDSGLSIGHPQATAAAAEPAHA
jgi:multiple sugar transport system ATP-binding protein